MKQLTGLEAEAWANETLTPRKCKIEMHEKGHVQKVSTLTIGVCGAFEYRNKYSKFYFTGTINCKGDE